MGLSASQARLLSITSRLSDNELRSQTITNAKTSLANETTAASAAYMDALSATELNYSFYDADGTKISMPLTGAVIYEYSELKNQYGIINQHGQILVSERDATNYENSANIAEFLQKYGFENSFTIEETTVIDEAAYNAALKEYTDWVGAEPAKTITNVIQEGYEEVKPAWTERVHSSDLYAQVMNTGCISGALSNSNCYMHVMASLIGAGPHKTSDGHEFEVVEYDPCPEHGNNWCWNTDRHPVDQSLKDALKNKYPCGEVHDEYVDLNHNGSIHQVWCKDDDCSTDKSVYQKIVDLLWEIHEDYTVGSSTGGTATAEHIAQFWHIVEFDLDEVTIVEHEEETIWHDPVTEEVPNPKYEEWLLNEVEEPDINDYTTVETSINVDAESEEGQWYINLWHRMNGPSIYKVTLNGYDNGVHDPENDGTIEGDNVTSPTNGRTEGGRPLYKVLEDGLMNNAEWLQYALRNGTVTLERVDFTNPTEYGTGLDKYTWNSIQWTTAADITESQNEAAITKAEVEYEQALNDIQAKDKMFDNQLKIFDTEHNALQTEYDSIKSIIEKTVERNLKLYS